MVAVGFEVTSVFSTGGLLAEELVLEASNRAFRVQQVGGHLAPGDEPNRRIGRPGTARIYNVGARLGALVVVTRRQPEERLRFRLGVAVDHVASRFVVEALQLGHVFRGTESIGIAAEVRQRLIDQTVIFHHAGGIKHRYGLGFAWLYALVEHPPCGLRNARTHGGLMLGAVVALLILGIHEDVVSLCHQLNDLHGLFRAVFATEFINQRWHG